MDAVWLKSNVGDPLLGGLAAVAEFQPEDSIEFLGRYLLKYVESKEAEMRRIESSKRRNSLVERSDIERREFVQVAANLERKKETAIDNLEKGVNHISQPCEQAFEETLHGTTSETGLSDALYTSLLSKYEQVIQTTLEATGSSTVYIGEVTAGSESKVFRVIASSDKGMIGQMIEEEAADDGNVNLVPFEVIMDDKPEEMIEEEEKKGEEVEEEDLKQEPALKLPRFSYIDNVLRSERVPFFGRVPLLGSFLSVCVPFENYMHKDAIPQDGGLIQPENSNQDNADLSQENSTAQISKSWRAETVKSFNVLCVDTMGIGKELNEVDVEKTRKIANALSSSITPTLKNMYQAEMLLRDSLKQLNTINTTILAEAIEQTDERVEAQVIAQQTEGNDIPEEEKTWKRALIKLDGYKNAIINENWWVNQFNNVRKLRIEPEDELKSSILLFLNIFLWNEEPKDVLDWNNDVKAVDIDQFVSKVRSIEENPETISGEKTGDYLEAVTALGDPNSISRDLGSWIAALATFTKAALEAIIAHAKYQSHLAALNEVEDAAAAGTDEVDEA